MKSEHTSVTDYKSPHSRFPLVKNSPPPRRPALQTFPRHGAQLSACITNQSVSLWANNWPWYRPRCCVNRNAPCVLGTQWVGFWIHVWPYMCFAQPFHHIHVSETVLLCRNHISASLFYNSGINKTDDRLLKQDGWYLFNTGRIFLCCVGRLNPTEPIASLRRAKWSLPLPVKRLAASVAAWTSRRYC